MPANATDAAPHSLTLARILSWTAGADVKSLHDALLPSLRVEVERVSRAGERIDAVVIICGLNDMKAPFLRANPSLHPLRFAENLDGLLQSVSKVAGAQCTVLLPGVPFGCAPRFSRIWPLSAVVAAVGDVWEAQKRKVAMRVDRLRLGSLQTRAENSQRSLDAGAPAIAGGSARAALPLERTVESAAATAPAAAASAAADGAASCFLEPPTSAEIVPAMFCEDGMHPNETGYSLWGERIAQRLLQMLPRDSH